jgi:hypothetical protein
MSEKRKNTPDDIRALIERVDDQLREAQRLRSYVNERSRRGEWWPERRRVPRVPQRPSNDDNHHSST